jgi:peptidoglycan hydrolase-like protein with peptidoglycan-binding domain
MAAMLAAPVQRAQADEFVGGLVGGLIGGAIGSGIANQKKQQQTTRRVYVQPRASSAQRQQTLEVQSSLNYFGFDAGVEDGVMGRNTRAAVSRYQGYMGFPVNGKLSSYQRSLLLGAYTRAQAGGPEVTRMISRSDEGARAVLIAQRDGMSGRRSSGYAGLPVAVSEAVDEVADSSDPSAEQLMQRSGFIQLADLNGDGSNDYIIDTALAGSSFWCNSAQCKTMVFASTAEGYRRNDLLVHQPTPAKLACSGGSCRVKAAPAGDGGARMAAAGPAQGEASGGGGMPVFDTAPKKRSLGSFCSKVGLLTSSNGGFTEAAEVNDPSFALSEQLCLTRTYAVAAGEELMATIEGADPAAIAQQCDAFGKTMAAPVRALAAKPAGKVLGGVNRVILDSGMTPEQLRTTARICMASGYKTETMRPALGGALLLTGLGRRPYAELVGHHLHGGFGTAKSRDMALTWYEMAFEALDGGQGPVFAPANPDRIEVVRAAAGALSGQAGTAPVPAAGGDGAMPVFTLSE